MKRNNKKKFKKNTNSINKLSLFQKNEGKFSKKCPLSVKNAPIVDYKNIGLLKKYVSENGKIVSSKITSVSFNKQRKLTREIKKAKILGNRSENGKMMFIYQAHQAFTIWHKKMPDIDDETLKLLDK